MAFRKQWLALVSGSGYGLSHLDLRRYVVTLHLSLTDAGPHSGRPVRLEMSPERAREIAAQLSEAADRAEVQQAHSPLRPWNRA